MQIVEIKEPGYDLLEQDASKAVGIDFGTTNSLIAIADNQVVTVIPDQNNKELIPSLLTFTDSGFIVGDKTLNDPSSPLTISSIKRLFGKSTQEIINNPHLYSLVRGYLDITGNAPRFKCGNKIITLPELGAEIFKYLKAQAEIRLKIPLSNAVVTVPAYFDNAARGEVLLAASLAGFKVLRLIAEPTAAAYAYGLNKQDIKGCYLVYDFGGGTFDVSLLNMQAGILQVIATKGDTMLGGDDIDYLLAEYLQENYNILPLPAFNIARQIKEALSKVEDYTISFQDQAISLSRQKFEQIIMPLIERTIKITQEALEQDEKAALEGIILVGGSSRIPLITRLLKAKFGINIFSDIDPDKAVVWGAALQAENLTTTKGRSLLIDVLPLSLGMELYGELVEKIILRNSPIPVSVTQKFTTYADNQTAMQFHIVQGERELAKDCRPLAKFELKGLKPMKAGRVHVEVTFSVDADGILSVTALDQLTGKSQGVEVNPSYGLKEDEVKDILEKAYQNAANDHKARLVQEAIVEATSLLYKLENSIAESPNILPSLAMEKIHQAITDLKFAMQLSDTQLILTKIKNLEELTKHFTTTKLNKNIAKLLTGKHIDKV